MTQSLSSHNHHVIITQSPHHTSKPHPVTQATHLLPMTQYPPHKLILLITHFSSHTHPFCPSHTTYPPGLVTHLTTSLYSHTHSHYLSHNSLLTYPTLYPSNTSHILPSRYHPYLTHSYLSLHHTIICRHTHPRLLKHKSLLTTNPSTRHTTPPHTPNRLYSSLIT